jgi:hypothetical protein
MGERVEPSALVVGHGHEVQGRLERCVAALRCMVDGGWFGAHEDTVGMEVEFDLVDPLGRPRPINDAVLARLGRADMQHELGQFNVELNLAPRRLRDRGDQAFSSRTRRGGTRVDPERRVTPRPRTSRAKPPVAVMFSDETQR